MLTAKRLCYKSSWAFDLGRHSSVKSNDKVIADGAVKDIAGFMNKNGGVLLLGVEDNCDMCGLENTDYLMQSNKDHRKKLDVTLLNIGNELSARLGKENLTLLSIQPFNYRGKTVVRVKAPRSSNPVIYRKDDEEKFYVRSGTATQNAGMSALTERYRNS